MDYDYHPLAVAFPALSEAELAALAADISANGLLEPITLIDGAVLDGRNRLAACRAAGVEPRFVNFTGSDPVAFVIAKNMARRHLTESQRGLIAAEIANIPVGANQHTMASDAGNAHGHPHISLEEAADKLKVGRRTAARAKKVLQSGDDALIAEVRSGKTSVRAAEEKLTATPKSRPVATEAPRAAPQPDRVAELEAAMEALRAERATETARLRAEIDALKANAEKMKSIGQPEANAAVSGKASAPWSQQEFKLVARFCHPDRFAQFDDADLTREATEVMAIINRDKSQLCGNDAKAASGTKDKADWANNMARNRAAYDAKNRARAAKGAATRAAKKAAAEQTSMGDI